MKAERWDIYDTLGRATGRTMIRGEALAAGETHLAAEVWIFDGQGRILLQRRAVTRTLLPGVWAMTTGCMLAGEDSAAGILRETREELGIQLRPNQLWHIRRIIRTDTVWDVYAARWDGLIETLILQPEEVSAARWVTPGMLRALLADGTAFAYPEIQEMLQAVETRMAKEGIVFIK